MNNKRKSLSPSSTPLPTRRHAPLVELSLAAFLLTVLLVALPPRNRDLAQSRLGHVQRRRILQHDDLHRRRRQLLGLPALFRRWRGREGGANLARLGRSTGRGVQRRRRLRSRIDGDGARRSGRDVGCCFVGGWVERANIVGRTVDGVDGDLGLRAMEGSQNQV